ncbi:hypothetical protein IQ264_08830 [Phormidium sp. LEGE 05292]|uniref:hypothetical protein n=1 Tax=[Phormidium] sp. LEGE 05292 TaxID=767427 RepID=UPI00188118E9|nr:hypothetical protein [Phormidium sp. LEGE 05292]MBE9225524.1 hypothetical protein [Phormidium sp. LEGE 05292]
MNHLTLFVGVAGVLVTLAVYLIVIVLREMFNLLAQDYRLKSEAKLEALRKLEACYLIEKPKLYPREYTEIYPKSNRRTTSSVE